MLWLFFLLAMLRPRAPAATMSEVMEATEREARNMTKQPKRNRGTGKDRYVVTCITLRPATLEQLRIMAELEETSVSALVRRGVDALLTVKAAVRLPAA